MKNIAIIGFGTAGLRAALSARSQDPSANVTVISEEKYLTYSRCGLPFVLSGEIKSFDDLFVISRHTLARSNINLLLGFRAVDIIGDTLYIENGKESKQLHFDSIIFATGSRVLIPPISGVNLNNVFTLRNIDDGLKIINSISNLKHIVIVGAGAIGLECAEAFYKRGLSITIVELMPRILPNILDEDMAKIVQERIINSNIKLIVGKKIEEIYGSSVVEGVSIDGENIPCDAVLIATGVKANVNLAKNIGLNIGTMGIKTNMFQETSKASIYAAGDCAETRHLITSKPYLFISNS
ncbi:MAG: FAD/NAD(P)-binding oxidoreductase [Candidatus Methanomethylicia archaeon]